VSTTEGASRKGKKEELIPEGNGGTPRPKKAAKHLK